MAYQLNDIHLGPWYFIGQARLNHEREHISIVFLAFGVCSRPGCHFVPSLPR